MNRAALVLLLVCCAAFFSEGCGAARKARKARKLEAARRADSVASMQRRVDSLLARNDSIQVTFPVTPDTVETPALDPTKSSIPAYILAQHGVGRPFRTFSGKAKLEYESAYQSVDATVIIRIRRDSAIWASVVAVGGAVPVARVLLTPDSVLYVNFIRREGARMVTRDAAGLLPVPVEFSQLQAILLNEAQAPRAAVVSTGSAEVSGVYYVATQTSATGYTSFYNAEDTSLIGEEARGTIDGSYTAARYRMFEKEHGKNFPMQREINLEIPGADSSTRHTILLTFTDAPRFDIPLEFSFSIPKNYTLK